MSLDFPVRPAATLVAGGRGISRFPCEVLACPGSQTARGPFASRDGDANGVAFRLSPRRRHPGVVQNFAARYPARTFPFNASPSASRPVAHDSGPVWVANPSPYETSIRNTSPVLTGARRHCGDGRGEDASTTRFHPDLSGNHAPGGCSAGMPLNNPAGIYLNRSRGARVAAHLRVSPAYLPACASELKLGSVITKPNVIERNAPPRAAAAMSLHIKELWRYPAKPHPEFTTGRSPIPRSDRLKGKRRASSPGFRTECRRPTCHRRNG